MGGIAEKHTPEPWAVIQPSKERPSRIAVGAAPQKAGAGWAVTLYDAPLTAETRANAYLIAAAPDLLDEAKKAAADIEEYGIIFRNRGDTMRGADCRERVDRLEAIIAKATP